MGVGAAVDCAAAGLVTRDVGLKVEDGEPLLKVNCRNFEHSD